MKTTLYRNDLARRRLDLAQLDAGAQQPAFTVAGRRHAGKPTDAELRARFGLPPLGSDQIDRRYFTSNHHR